MQEGEGRFGFPVDNTIGGTPQVRVELDHYRQAVQSHALRCSAAAAPNATQSWPVMRR